MSKAFKAAFLVTASTLLLGGCSGSPTAPIEPEESVGLPNPASVYCVEQGGTLVIRTEAAGGEYGVCVFGDGRECDEWAYLRGECQPGDAADK